MHESRRAELALAVERVQAQIAAACAASGRDRDSLRLIAVSKLKPASDIRLVYELGVRDFGENYVQELTRKQTELRDLEDLRWHLIGPLQRNKVKQLVGSPPLIHTLDNERLGDEIERRFGEAGKKCGVLVEVNLGDETQKAGCAVDALPGLLARAKAWEHVDVRGLMAIPPVTEDPEASRVHFRRLRELRGDYGSPGFELSMGMSHDFVQAIGEGATLIRVGTAIFGARAGL